MSSKNMSNFVSHLRTLQRTITPIANSVMKGPQLGFSIAMYSQIGNHQGPSYGSMGNVCSPGHPCRACVHEFTDLAAGLGKNTLMYVTVSRLLLCLPLTESNRSAIIQDIEGYRTPELAAMAYYYCDFREGRKQDRDGLLSSLLFQLSAESDACYRVLAQLHSNNAGRARKPTSSALTSAWRKC